MQERFKVDALALAFGVKAVVGVLMLPLALWHGLPSSPAFYIGIVVMSVLWCMNDVLYFRAIPVVGAGVVSRLLPGTTVASFFLWFLFDPALIQTYIDRAWIGLGLVISVLGIGWSASRLSRCHVSRHAVRLLWPVLAIGCIGPIGAKLILENAGPAAGAPFVFGFCQSVTMFLMLGLYKVFKRPVPRREWYNADTLKACILTGCVMGGQIALSSLALLKTEHPSYVSALLFTDAIWIIVIYRMLGRREEANVGAGLGIVAGAIALVILRSI
ncbi:MAG: hypothetical protein AB7H77_04295 [Bdellovibrionales bacterium]